MKKNIVLLFIAVFSGAFSVSAQFQHQNISLMSIWNDTTVVPEPTFGIRFQGCWGWVDTTSGREYAIIGSSKPGTFIVEVTNPYAPVTRAYIPGISWQNHSIWHEYKSYGKYLYIASDDGGQNTFQIADMSYLPDSVHLVLNDSSIFKRSHTLFIDGNKLYCGAVTLGGNASYSMAVYSLANPALPQFLTALNLDTNFSFITWVHDMFVRNDTVYASCGGLGLYIFKFNSDTTFSQISNLANPNGDYNHSSFLTDDGRTLVTCNEVPDSLPALVVDVSDIHNPDIVDSITSADGATPHNPYIKNGRAIIAYYRDGVRVYDISNPSAAVQIGFFDTDTLVGGGSYSGCWGAYTELPSGILLASDMQNGLFILNADSILSVGVGKTSGEMHNDFSIFPNPVNNKLAVGSGQLTINRVEIYDVLGEKILRQPANGEKETIIDVSNLTEGIYFVKVTGEKNNFVVKKFVKVH